MTIKRFTTTNGVFYTDTKTGYEFQCYGEVTNIMNELSEENQHLKKTLKELKEINDYQTIKIKKLNNKNNLIKDTIDKKITTLTDTKIKSIQNENKELYMKIKFTIQVLRELKEAIQK